MASPPTDAISRHNCMSCSPVRVNKARVFSKGNTLYISPKVILPAGILLRRPPLLVIATSTCSPVDSRAIIRRASAAKFIKGLSGIYFSSAMDASPITGRLMLSTDRRALSRMVRTPPAPSTRDTASTFMLPPSTDTSSFFLIQETVPASSNRQTDIRTEFLISIHFNAPKLIPDNEIRNFRDSKEQNTEEDFAKQEI